MKEHEKESSSGEKYILLNAHKLVPALGLPVSIDFGTWLVRQCISGNFGESLGYLHGYELSTPDLFKKHSRSLDGSSHATNLFGFARLNLDGRYREISLRFLSI